MGANPYWYYVPFQPDVDAALQKLRRREFEAGRYFPVLEMFDQFPLNHESPSPGPQHSTIADAVNAAEEEGTGSILDLDHISEHPEIFGVSPCAAELLEDCYGTLQPTRAMVESNQSFFEEMDRGEGIYIVLYSDGKPDEILFAGYSFD